MTRIGGTNDWTLAATMHRPRDADGLRAAAIDMQRRGLQPRDIAPLLELTESGVIALLEDAGVASDEVRP